MNFFCISLQWIQTSLDLEGGRTLFATVNIEPLSN